MVLHTLGKKAASTKESLVNPAGVFLCTFNLGKDRGLVFHYDTESHTHTQPSSVLFFQTGLVLAALSLCSLWILQRHLPALPPLWMPSHMPARLSALLTLPGEGGGMSFDPDAPPLDDTLPLTPLLDSTSSRYFSVTSSVM